MWWDLTEKIPVLGGESSESGRQWVKDQTAALFLFNFYRAAMLTMGYHCQQPCLSLESYLGLALLLWLPFVHGQCQHRLPRSDIAAWSLCCVKDK